MEQIQTGWERDRRTHFNEIAAQYDRTRWEYPAELYRDLLAYTGSGAGTAALEIGAGTGKATQPMLQAGYAVTAVELGENMAEFLQNRFRENRGFRVIVSSFEEADLPDDGCDLIYAASAFHWVDAEIGCPKALRLLKSDGVFALFRNNANPVRGSGELHKDLRDLYEQYYLSFYTKNKLPGKQDRVSLTQPAEISRGFGFTGMEPYGFTDVTMKFYEATHTYDADAYIALLETYADHRGLPEKNKAALYAGVKDAIIKNGGLCYQDGLFQLYMGRKP